MYQDENYNYENNTGLYSGYQPYSSSNSNQPKKPEKKKGKFFSKAVLSIALGLLFGFSAGASFYAIKAVSDYTAPAAEEKAAILGAADTNEKTVPNADTSTGSAAVAANVSVSIPDVVEKSMPAVVSITGEFVTEQNIWGRTYERTGEGSGSGIIVGENDTELLIATNNHVIADARQLSVQFIDGEQAEAKIKGTDSTKDLAVIAVQLSDIKPETLSAINIAELGDSDNLRVGETVIAIGNALGYGQSVTTGVISAIDREVNVDGVQGTFLQTNAAINFGNSGGALLNDRGQVIGINSNKLGGNAVEGMGYAIPISMARPILENLMTKTTRIEVEEAKKGYLGIVGVDVSSEVTNIYGIPEGVYVDQVYENTPAAAAGIVKGNIITRFDGSAVRGMTELQSILNYYAAGTTVEVTVMEGSPNGYTEKTVMITLASREEQTQ